MPLKDPIKRKAYDVARRKKCMSHPICRSLWRKRDHDRRMRSLYGISRDQYLDMLQKQKGKCAICGRRPHRARSLSVDHDHATGAVRGLLCTRCNVQLGVVEQFRERAERYLRDYGSRSTRR